MGVFVYLGVGGADLRNFLDGIWGDYGRVRCKKGTTSAGDFKNEKSVHCIQYLLPLVLITLVWERWVVARNCCKCTTIFFLLVHAIIIVIVTVITNIPSTNSTPYLNHLPSPDFRRCCCAFPYKKNAPIKNWGESQYFCPKAVKGMSHPSSPLCQDDEKPGWVKGGEPEK